MAFWGNLESDQENYPGMFVLADPKARALQADFAEYLFRSGMNLKLKAVNECWLLYFYLNIW